ncbi:MAG: glycosyltransferase [Bacteroidales bacterium]|nr:glycosyltransferase [Bacteroidales bacterium]
MFYIFIIVVVPYLILALWLWRGWVMLSRFEMAGASVSISVIIPVRNEEANIGNLLSDIANQHYSQKLVQVVVVDDHSTDRSATIVEEFAREQPNVQLLHLPGEKYGKKAALQHALPHLTGTLAVTTDADCRVRPRWLATIASFYTVYKPDMIICPVMFTYGRSFFSRWQALELMSLTGSSAGAASWRQPVMCSGANLVMKRNVMERYAYVYDSPLASGDDMMMMLELKKDPNGRIFYLKSTGATVTTPPPSGLKSFIRQRNRWTSKSKAYADPMVILVAIAVFMANLSLLACCVAAFFHFRFLWLAAILWLAKMVVDWLFLNSLCRFWQMKPLMHIFIPAQLLYPFYVVWVGIAGNITPVRWKGRRSML